VARAILREVREGRGSPHGGVFLDISWIRSRIPNASKHIIKKLPSMYHQFKQLADIDITTTPMEVGPTTHYIMGGIRVDGNTQSSTLPGVFAAGECAAGLHGANRLGGNSLSDLLVFGKRAGEFAAAFARDHRLGEIDVAEVEDAIRYALAPFERGPSDDGGGPYQLQQDLQTMMQNLVGIVRTEREMKQALKSIARLKERARQVGVTGNREYNPGWHTGLDLANLLTVSEAITRSAIERRESRGGHFRDDYPEKDPAGATFNVVIRKGEDAQMRLSREPVAEMPEELKRIVQEQR
jgi:succinate dehydrogenase / fumarate reductase flavoprotein subunit